MISTRRLVVPGQTRSNQRPDVLQTGKEGHSCLLSMAGRCPGLVALLMTAPLATGLLIWKPSSKNKLGRPLVPNFADVDNPESIHRHQRSRPVRAPELG
jgi:hypothetical protein